LLEGANFGQKACVGSAVRLESVTKTFGPVRALVSVTLDVPFGATTVIEGPNGSGKSTLLAILGTLAHPTTGRVVHDALGETPLDVRRVLGWVGHESLCYGDLTGRENIELAARLHGRDPKEAFDRASARFDLAAFASRAVRTYSRGQRQRVALARALVHQPKLVLLDEPTTGLDVSATERLLAVVNEERERGAAVVVVTHDPAFAESTRGARIRLDRGRVQSEKV
jgi:heme exporter protein A